MKRTRPLAYRVNIRRRSAREPLRWDGALPLFVTVGSLLMLGVLILPRVLG